MCTKPNQTGNKKQIEPKTNNGNIQFNQDSTRPAKLQTVKPEIFA